MSKSIMQDEKKCYVTGAEYVPLHKHHIYAGKNRQASERHGFWVWLIPELHNMSNAGVHFDKAFDLRLRRECQAKFEETHTREEFMAIIGANYL